MSLIHRTLQSIIVIRVPEGVIALRLSILNLVSGPAIIIIRFWSVNVAVIYLYNFALLARNSLCLLSGRRVHVRRKQVNPTRVVYYVARWISIMHGQLATSECNV